MYVLMQLTHSVTTVKQRSRLVGYLNIPKSYSPSSSNSCFGNCFKKDVTAILRYEYDPWDQPPSEDNIFEFDLRHNETLRKRKHDKDYIYPNYEFFHSWLVHYAHMDEQALEISLNKYNEARSELRSFKWGYVKDEDLFWMFEDGVEDEIIPKQADNVVNLN